MKKIPGDLIKAWILNSGYKSINNFCMQNEMYQSSLDAIINDRKDHKYSTLDRIANALGIEVWELVKPRKKFPNKTQEEI